MASRQVLARIEAALIAALNEVSPEGLRFLAGRRLVPEFFQEQVEGAALGDALLKELEDRDHVRELLDEFAAVHRSLRRGGAARAAEAILECIGRRADAATVTERVAGA